MLKNIRSIRGMYDYLPKTNLIWQKIEYKLKKVLSSYGYNEIKFPIIENTKLFKKSIGNITDIVEKEMYSFNDKSGNNLTLRPEGTVSCVRASLQNGILYNQEQRLWYLGPMFRYERPQKGRYRQFHQLGIEIFGLPESNIEIELLMITLRWWKILNINKYMKLEINYIGSSEERYKYKKDLIIFLEKYKNELDLDCRNRLYKNPLRILDTKNFKILKILKKAPNLKYYLNNKSLSYFNNLLYFLKFFKINYKINHNLFRGLDYYNGTVFEWKTNFFENKDITICAGGRYDNLVKQIGGYHTPAIGCAMGLERLLMLFSKCQKKNNFIKYIDIYIIVYNLNKQYILIKFAEIIRDILPKIKVFFDFNHKKKIKKKIVKAKQMKSSFVIILKKNKIKTNKLIIINLNNGDKFIKTKKQIIKILSKIKI
ncbi:histidine--tRNA ligase [Candidatus Annandia pinicola]|uniref:histidine--tRNA ligase n=1 Tax=Candidatus Annandia pinicola TaxID=1345117 RepID=UPI001D004894|nr:histidine--tRNA ligase [Candidatus Annandia pinicola]UDG80331.1 Histidine--tRNA ligase [Candidatus Annandia pinicola]